MGVRDPNRRIYTDKLENVGKHYIYCSLKKGTGTSPNRVRADGFQRRNVVPFL